MKRGVEISGRAAATAGLCRSVCPTASVAPDADAMPINRSASSSDAAMGFSTRTATPASRSGAATRAWSRVGTATTTPSTSEATAPMSLANGAPTLEATARARSSSQSTTATSSISGAAPRIRAWCCPKCPTPTTAARKAGVIAAAFPPRPARASGRRLRCRHRPRPRTPGRRPARASGPRRPTAPRRVPHATPLSSATR